MLIEVFADVVCPWCYIGRYRLGRALAERPRLVPDIRWQSYQLNPDMPRGGMARADYLVTRLGGLDKAHAMLRLVEETAGRDGIPIELERIRRTPNTMDAHRVIRMANRAGRGERMIERLFTAFFVEGIDIGDRATLSALAAEIGLDADEVAEKLESGAETMGVRGSDALARHLGLQAVPTFVFNRRYALSGAQEPTCILPLLALDLCDDPVDPNL